MKPVNIFALTRLEDTERQQLLERQLSKRSRYLKIKEWETKGLREFSEMLDQACAQGNRMRFYYSFIMPKLGKEFDLLRIDADSIVNVELKSRDVTDEAIKRQLLQNKYYLATLGRNMYFYTFISESKRLVRLSNSGRLVEATWDELVVVLENQKDLYTGPIEELFKEEEYLISPLTDPGRFLRQEYFLTSQQRDIRKQILSGIRTPEGGIRREALFHGFTGLPGTGKTILLYDLAIQLSHREMVCVFHFGSYEQELQQLDQRLKRVDFYYFSLGDPMEVDKRYAAILVDEGHRLDEGMLQRITDLANEWKAPVIFSYDREDVVSSRERQNYGGDLIEKVEGFHGYKLTNRIRLNSELSAFIACVMRIRGRNNRRDYPSVSLVYANDEREAGILLGCFAQEGYVYIRDRGLSQPEEGAQIESVDAMEATCKEFDRVVMLLDETFFYDEDGYLRARETVNDDRVRNIYHGLGRAKKKIALVVKNNGQVFDGILSVLQKWEP